MTIKPNPARVAELRGTHGTYTAVEIAQREAREAALVELRGLIYDLSPGSGPDFAVDLRDVLGRIVDLLED